MGKVYSIMGLVCMFFIMQLQGQNNYSVTNYTTTNGLPTNNIKCVAVDQTGTVWFGSTSGLTKYNGTTFTTYTTTNGLANNSVNRIFVAQNGDILIATNNGLSRYNGTTFTNSLSGDILKCVFEAQNTNVWVGTSGGGVKRYNGTTWTTYTVSNGIPHNFVNTITQDQSNNIWIGTSEGLGRFNGTTWTTFTNINGVDNGADQVISSRCDADGVLWFGSKPSLGIGGGVTRFNGTTWNHYNTAEGLAGRQVEDMTSDPADNKWIGTLNGASLCKDHNYPTVTFQTISTAGGLISNQIQGIAIAPDGHIWVATISGVSRISPIKINSITVIDAKCNTNFEGSVIVDAVGLSSILYYSIDGGTNYQTSNTFSGLVPDTYTVHITDNSHTSVSSPATVSLLAPIQPNLPETLTACSSDSTQLNAPAAGSNYVWTPAQYFSAQGIHNPKVSLPSTQSIYLTMDDANGCEVSDSIFITILPSTEMTISVSGNVFTCVGNFVSWQWTYYFNNIPGAFTNVHAATQPGIYGCIATDSQGCKTNSGMIHYLNADINESQITPEMNVTYGADGISISLANMFNSPETMILHVYSVNGQKAASTELHQTANGKYNSKINTNELPSGIYVISVEGTQIHGKISVVK